jgi:heme/copper-type cytochrome/quinol oxidase subunit 4
MEIQIQKKLSSKFQSILEAGILGLLALVIYVFTIADDTRGYALPALTIILVIVGVTYFFHLRYKKEKSNLHEQRTFRVLIFACVSAILLWVGTTGWFVSPFFYLLYLAAISLAFLFNTSVAFSFILVVVAILLPQISGVKAQIDILSLVSLLLVVPLAYYLRQEYVKRIEREKKILVLEKEHKVMESKVEEVLANKVVSLGAQLREPINDIRQIALFAERNGGPRDIKDFNKIIISTGKAFDVLNTFEQETTGKTLVRTPKKEVTVS